MTVNKKILFDKTRALWPKFIDKEVALEHSGSAQILNELRYKIEASISEDDHWMQISVWSYHQALWAYLLQSVNSTKSNKEIAELSLHDVEFDEFDRMMIQNLNGDDCWAEERKIYLDS